MSGYRIDPVLGCWLWEGAVTSKGYPLVFHEGRTRLARRVYYEQAKGEIPSGTVLRCGCLRKRCVNPDHMEPTPRDVALRMPRRRRSR